MMSTESELQPAIARPFWRRGLGLMEDERVRFVIIGGINTAVGYLLFALLELVFGNTLGYFFSLYGSFLLSSVTAFVLHRRVTFRVSGSGHVLVDFGRFLSVYIFALVVNSVALPLLVELVGMNPLIAQAIIVIATTLVSYFGHKFFSFRRGADG